MSNTPKHTIMNRLNSLRQQRGEEGFTLIELLVVIIIIGILTAIALPLFFTQQAEGVKAGMKSDVRNTVGEVTTHLVSNPTAADLTSSKTGEAAATGVIKPVVTDENTTVRVAGSWTGFTVAASNTSIDDFGYAHYSSDTAPAVTVGATAIPAATAGQGGTYVTLAASPTAPQAPDEPDTTPETGTEADPNADNDGDGAVNGEEISGGPWGPTDPNNPDSDGDGYSDGDEMWLHSTNPNDPNSTPDNNPDDDGDGWSTIDESAEGTDPFDPNSHP